MKDYKSIDWREQNWEAIEVFMYEELPGDEQYPFLKFIAEQGREPDWRWLDDVYESADVSDLEKRMGLLEDFVSWFPQNYPKWYQEVSDMYEEDLITYHLYTNNDAKLKERLDFIRDWAEKGYDFSFDNLYSRLLYYGHFTELLNMSKQMYKLTADEISQPEKNKLLSGVFLQNLEDTYRHYKKTGEFNLDKLRAFDREFGINIGDIEENLMVDTLQNPLDSDDVLAKFKAGGSYRYTLTLLGVHFSKYMFDEYQMPFMLSDDLWDAVITKFLFGESQQCNEFFYMDLAKFDKDLDMRLAGTMGAEPLFELFARVFALDYIYEFLKAKNLISAEGAREMRENNKFLRRKMVIMAAEFLWELSFVFDWPKPEKWKNLKPLFEASTQFMDEAERKEQFDAHFLTDPESDRVLEEVREIYEGREDFFEDEIDEDFLRGLEDEGLFESEEFRQLLENEGLDKEGFLEVVHNKDNWDDTEDSSHSETYIRKSSKVGRNDPCPCGSGKKYKKCCMNKDKK